MTRSLAAAALLMTLAFGTGTAWAENPAPAAQPPASKMSDADKKVLSKACTEQANAKGLHGKARKKFRSECKHNGGKVE